MLVLTRKAGEKIILNDNITIVVNRVAGNRVTLGIEAPDDVRIIRGELEDIVRDFDEPQEKSPALPVFPCETASVGFPVHAD